MEQTLDEKNLLVLNRIKKDFFVESKFFPVQIEIALEGQKIDDNKNFVIGCRAGSSCEVSNLLHEMGHFAEREPKKLLKRPYGSWGYSFGKHWQIGSKSGYDPLTDQSVRRELRIWAFQWNLEQYYGISNSIEDLVSSAVYLSAFGLYNLYKDAERTDYRSEKERLIIAEAEVAELAKIYTFEAFKKAWWERIKLLQLQDKRRKKRKSLCT